MSPVSLSRAAQFVCSGCCTIQSKRGSTQEHREPGSAVSGLQHSGKRHCHQSPLHLSPPQAAPPAAVGTFSAASSLVSPLPSPGCVSSLLCQTQVLQKNTPSLSPSPNHGAGLKTTGRKGDRKTDTTFWAVFFASWVFGGRELAQQSGTKQGCTAGQRAGLHTAEGPRPEMAQVKPSCMLQGKRSQRNKRRDILGSVCMPENTPIFPNLLVVPIKESSLPPDLG